MKKIFILAILTFLLVAFPKTIYANTDYYSYESFELNNGKLIYDWTKEEAEEYFKEVDGRIFIGWRTYNVTKRARATYDTETLFSYYNDGYTPIEYEYKHEIKSSHKVALSASGSIGVSNSESKKEFKNGLNASLKLDASYTFNQEEKEEYKIKLQVDPGTQVDLFIHGEGKITNGVAARYFFFFQVNRGAYEIFTVTTQYYRLEKKKI